MAVVRVFTPANPLHDVLVGHGQSAATLTAAAEQRVARLQPQIREQVARLSAQVLEIAAEPETEVFARSLELGHAALEICEIAAAGGQVELGEVARGIHSMADALVQRGVWHTDALQVHVTALRLLSAEPPPSDAGRIVADLRDMRLGLGALD